MAALSVLPNGMPVSAQTKAAPPAAASTGTCAVLMRQYDGASMDLASGFAASVGDNSAPRATLREMENGNALATAKIALDLMRDNRCAMPKSAPSTAPYLTAALNCRNDQLKASRAESPESCKRENWTRAGQ
ncbi:hypothetical protein [Sphingomonas sp. RS2018]